MPVKETYPVGAGNAISTYNYTDIAEGTGIISLLGYKQSASGAATFALGTTTFSSPDITTQYPTNVSTTIDFDLGAFNLPRTAKGTATIRQSMWCDGSGAVRTLNCDYQIIKVSGGVETVFGNEGMGAIVTPGAPTGLAANRVTPIVLTQTHFKKGDSLKVRMVCKTAVGFAISHDPNNRADVAGHFSDPVLTPTKLEVFMPFKIEID